MRQAVLTTVFWCALVYPAAAQQIAWEPFAFDAPLGGRVTADRGWLEVPVHHGRAEGGRIRLPVVRLRTSNQSPGPPVVFLAGGPATPALGS